MKGVAVLLIFPLSIWTLSVSLIREYFYKGLYFSWWFDFNVLCSFLFFLNIDVIGNVDTKCQ